MATGRRAIGFFFYQKSVFNLSAYFARLDGAGLVRKSNSEPQVIILKYIRLYVGTTTILNG